MQSRKDINKEHALFPEPGDYWNEMLVGICVVLSVDSGNVVICKTKKKVDKDHWTWDLSKTDAMTRMAFYEWLEYDTIPGSFWCSVVPNRHMWAVTEWQNINTVPMLSESDKEFWEGCPV